TVVVQQKRPGRGAHRQFALASAIGGAMAGLLFCWMLTAGSFDLLRRQPLGDFYDAQAHALLHGHWDVARQVLGIEAFVVHGRAYMYFGPVPAILRLPVAAFTHALDGRLTQVSMLLAFGVALLYVSRWSWRVRSLVREDAPV